MITVTVCVGSSCHLRGARTVIERFSELLAQHDLGEKVVLKGSFCMERCGEGINWQIDDEPLTSAGEDEAIEVFRMRVLEPFDARSPDEQEEGGAEEGQSA
jgi:NADH:ubiquinone oxidoreductase subunit E